MIRPAERDYTQLTRPDGTGHHFYVKLDGPHDLRVWAPEPTNAILWWEIFACKKCEKFYRIPRTLDLNEGIRENEESWLSLIEAKERLRREYFHEIIDPLLSYFGECKDQTGRDGV